MWQYLPFELIVGIWGIVVGLISIVFGDYFYYMDAETFGKPWARLRSHIFSFYSMPKFYENPNYWRSKPIRIFYIILGVICVVIGICFIQKGYTLMKLAWNSNLTEEEIIAHFFPVKIAIGFALVVIGYHLALFRDFIYLMVKERIYIPFLSITNQIKAKEIEVERVPSNIVRNVLTAIGIACCIGGVLCFT